MRKLVLLLFLVVFSMGIISCGTSKTVQASESSIKAQAEARYAELVKRQNQLLQENGEAN